MRMFSIPPPPPPTSNHHSHHHHHLQQATTTPTSNKQTSTPPPPTSNHHLPPPTSNHHHHLQQATTTSSTTQQATTNPTSNKQPPHPPPPPTSNHHHLQQATHTTTTYIYFNILIKFPVIHPCLTLSPLILWKDDLAWVVKTMSFELIFHESYDNSLSNLCFLEINYTYCMSHLSRVCVGNSFVKQKNYFCYNLCDFPHLYLPVWPVQSEHKNDNCYSQHSHENSKNKVRVILWNKKKHW